MQKSMLFLVFLIVFGPLHAQIYKWTDGDGNVHFTDKPHPGAEKVELPEVQTFSSPPIPKLPPELTQKDKSKAVDYKVSIVDPPDQVTIRNTMGYVPVNVQVEPALKSGDKLQLMFDGMPLGEPQATTVFALRDINRGSHTLSVQVVNEKGKDIAKSKEITIFMQQPRVGMGRHAP